MTARLLIMLTVLLLSACSQYAAEPPPDCLIAQGACKKQTSTHGTVTLDINPRPVLAMRELTFTVTLDSARADLPETLEIDLTMPGMSMGLNRVRLRRIEGGRYEGGRYEGTGVLVRCTSGRRTWRASVEDTSSVATDHSVEVAAFTFQVER